ncbi:hypothetical protein FUAX_34270 [Fulvitalea axinellae]|uniref:Uncharacterized protein n=1 Tax=Fulvitalea axinellae TaxID=1182444 RepID=A0AAU9DER9_9BACT|nr:hypothetical protein FUAX_34270 [Fulvitalea axinellae]
MRRLTVALALFIFGALTTAQAADSDRFFKKYPQAQKGIEEFCARSVHLDHIDYKNEVARQRKAFLKIAKHVEKGLTADQTEKLEWSLLRWSWQYGNSRLDSGLPVDWTMVLFEFRRHTGLKD